MQEENRKKSGSINRQWLEQHLREVIPADEVEAGHRDRMIELLGSGGDPFSRHHFVPGHFTASAFVLSAARDALLLILHGKLHRWLQPGGHVDDGDADLIAAARREVLEETGLAGLVRASPGIFDVDIHTIPARPRKREPAHEHFDVRFLFIAESDRLDAASDAQDARWVRLDQINEAMTDASVMRGLAKLKTRC